MAYDTAIPRDKLLHLAAGALVCAGVALGVSVPAGILAAGLAGAGKEAWDRWSNLRRARQGLPAAHDVDANDLLATLAGGFAAAVVVIIAQAAA